MIRPTRGGACRPVFFAALICAASPAFALGEAGQPGAYLRAGGGGRALAMGNAYVALAQGAEAALWNPAGLGEIQRASFESSVSVLSLSRALSDANLAIPFSKEGRGWGTWSVSWLHFSLGSDFEGRSGDTSTFYAFADQQDAFTLAHGRRITDWLLVGAGGKFFQRRLDQYGSSGAGLDLGLLLLPHPRLRLGVSGSEVYSSNRWNTGFEERFPTLLRVGLSGELLKDRLLLSTQANALEGRQPSYQAGLEARYKGLAALRAGLQDQGFTLGGGLSLAILNARVAADYAFAPDPLGLGNTQRFSLSIEF